MKKYLYFILVIFFCFLTAVSGELSNIEALSRGNSSFAASLYGRLKSEGGNVCFSPFSISSCMAMAYAGARSTTAEEMASALNLPSRDETVHLQFKELTALIMESGKKSGQVVSIANGLCLTGGDVSGEYKILLKEKYDAEIFSGDLVKINNWVKNKTSGKIEKILSELSRDSVCVLLNAVYFKGLWENAFEKKKTQEADFRTADGGAVKAKMMYQKNKFRFLQKTEYKALELPYKKETFSMIILLPERTNGLEKLENDLTERGIATIVDEIAGAPKHEVSVFLPKFRMETSYDLIEPLMNMGMKEAFGDNADFSGMGWTKGKVFIEQVKHKAFIDVDEEGTEAAAATGAAFSLTAFKPPLVFRADHPFLFLIRENTTGSILFIGRVCVPTVL